LINNAVEAAQKYSIILLAIFSVWL